MRSSSWPEGWTSTSYESQLDINSSPTAFWARSSRKEKPNGRDGSSRISEAGARRVRPLSCSCNSWDELRESIVTSGWDFADPALEGDEESDPVVEKFRLEMAQSSEDEDIREMRAEIPEDYDEEEEDNE
jgi:hypothetical protein